MTELWAMADIVRRHQEYQAAESSANTRMVARLGMIACAAAKTAADIGPRFVRAPDEWGWPDAKEQGH